MHPNFHPKLDLCVEFDILGQLFIRKVVLASQVSSDKSISYWLGQSGMKIVGQRRDELLPLATLCQEILNERHIGQRCWVCGISRGQKADLLW